MHTQQNHDDDSRCYFDKWLLKHACIRIRCAIGASTRYKENLYGWCMESIQLFWGFHLIECEQEFVNAELQARLILSLSLYMCNNWQIKRNGKTFRCCCCRHENGTWSAKKNTHEIRKSKGTKHAFTMMKNEQEAHDFFSSAFQIAKWHVKKHLVAY